MPEEHTLAKCVPRVATYFDKIHQELPPTDEALALHQSYQGAFNVKSYLEREAGEVHSGAALGAAPWHLGELASALCVFDIFRAYAQKKICVEEDLPRDSADDEDAKRRKMAAYSHSTTRSQSAFAASRGSEEGVASRGPEGAGVDAAAELHSPGAEEGGHEEEFEPSFVGEEQREDKVSDQPGEAAATSAAPQAAHAHAAALLEHSDVRGLDYGYADDGKSVQGNKLHAKGLTDRRIMQRTLLLGKPSMSSKEACQNMRSSNADGKKALPTWATVMEAGLKGCDVAWFDNR